MNKYLKVLVYVCAITACFTLGFLGAITLSSFDFSRVKVDAKSIPRVFIIESGSMEPAIKTGGIVITQASNVYRDNDVISFSYDENKKEVITHRIEYINYDELGNKTYQTSGDANKTFDGKVITDANIIGKVVFTMPYLGYFADFAKKPQGFILLIVVPATIIIYEELKNLWHEIIKRLKKFRVTKINTLKVQSSQSMPLNKVAVLIPFFGAFLLFISISSAFFSDTETSVGNSFTAYVPTPTPTPTTPPVAQTLIINEVMPNSNCNLGGGKSSSWIEIWNGFDVPVDLKNFKLNDGTNTVDIVNAVTVLQPDSFALLAKDGSVWTQCYTPAPGSITVNLGNASPINLASGIIKIIDTDGTTVLDRVEFSPTLQPDTSTERVALGQDTALGDTFNASDFGNQCPPTPGTWTALNAICPVVINEINWGGSHLGGSDGTNDEWIELRNMTSTPINLTGWSIKGAVSGGGGLAITSGVIPADGLLLISNFNETTSRINIVPDIVNTAIQLDNSNAKYFLYNNLGSIVDSADDGSGVPFAGVGTAAKKSMERKTIPGYGGLSTNWQTATTHSNMDGSGTTDEFGTPKAANGL